MNEIHIFLYINRLATNEYINATNLCHKLLIKNKAETVQE